MEENGKPGKPRHAAMSAAQGRGMLMGDEPLYRDRALARANINPAVAMIT